MRDSTSTQRPPASRPRASPFPSGGDPRESRIMGRSRRPRKSWSRECLEELSRCARFLRAGGPTGACGLPTPRRAARGSSGRRTPRPAPRFAPGRSSSRRSRRSAGRRRTSAPRPRRRSVLGRVALDLHLRAGPACLHPERAPCAPLAGEAVADRDPDRVVLDLDRELPARAGSAPRHDRRPGGHAGIVAEIAPLTSRDPPGLGE
jgi:hypothetical protein